MLPALLAGPEQPQGVDFVQLLANYFPIDANRLLTLYNVQQQVPFEVQPGGLGDAGGGQREEPEPAAAARPPRQQLSHVFPVKGIQLLGVGLVPQAVLVQHKYQVASLLIFPVLPQGARGGLIQQLVQHLLGLDGRVKSGNSAYFGVEVGREPPPELGGNILKELVEFLGR